MTTDVKALMETLHLHGDTYDAYDGLLYHQAADALDDLLRERDEARRDFQALRELFDLNPSAAYSRAESAETELAKLRADGERYRWWRENFEWLTQDGDGIEGCAFSCQVPLDVINKSEPSELMDMVADYEINAAKGAKHD